MLMPSNTNSEHKQAKLVSSQHLGSLIGYLCRSRSKRATARAKLEIG